MLPPGQQPSNDDPELLKEIHDQLQQEMAEDQLFEFNWIVDILFGEFNNKRLFDKKYNGGTKRKCKYVNISNY